MFCASLRRRPSFAPVCNSLTLIASGGMQGRTFLPRKQHFAANARPENQLTSHDIAVPSGHNIDPRTNTKTSIRHLRILLFAPSAVSHKQLEATIERIEALATQSDAEQNDIAIIFLLSQPRNTSFLSAKLAVQNNDNDTTSGVLAYTTLQASLKNDNDIPPIVILPLSRLEGLPALIKKHAMATSRQRHPLAASVPSTFELLTQCSAQSPMREQTAYVCTDIFTDMRDMAKTCLSVTSPPASSSPSARAAVGLSSQYFGEEFDVNGVPVSSGAGGVAAQKKLKMLRDMVGDRECQNVVDFWKEEFAVE